jgi:hypothetical protein
MRMLGNMIHFNLPSIQEDMNVFRMQLKIGSIQRAYKALLVYMMDLRTHLKKRHPGYAFSGLYQGYMDMTYFAIVPPLFKHQNMNIECRTRNIEPQNGSAVNAAGKGRHTKILGFFGVDR